MKYLKELLHILFTIYFVFFFGLMILFMFLVFKIQYFFFKDKYETQYKDILFRGVGKVMRILGFLRVNDIYHSKYSKEQSYVVVGNHNAALDIPLNTSSCPANINMKFLGKAEAAKIPVLGVLIGQLTVLVDRKNSESRKKTFDLMAAEIAKGYSIFVYPEGTRNRTDAPLKNFYDGAFRMAIQHQLPLVVCTLVGSKSINPPIKKLRIKPGKITAHWEKPIETKGMTQDDLEALREKVKAIMIARLEQGVI